MTPVIGPKCRNFHYYLIVYSELKLGGIYNRKVEQSLAFVISGKCDVKQFVHSLGYLRFHFFNSFDHLCSKQLANSHLEMKHLENNILHLVSFPSMF